MLLWTLKSSLVAQTVKRLPTMRETRIQSLGREDPLEKEMATHSSTLAWKIPCTEEPGRLQSMGLQRVRHDWATSLHFLNTSICSERKTLVVKHLADQTPVSLTLPPGFAQHPDHVGTKWVTISIWLTPSLHQGSPSLTAKNVTCWWVLQMHLDVWGHLWFSVCEKKQC